MELSEHYKSVVTEAWKFENNWDLKDVRLVHMETSTIFDVSNAFKEHMGEIMAIPPLPVLDVGPEDSVSQAGKSSASSTEQPRDPDFHGSASMCSKATPAKFRKVLKGAGAAVSVAAPPAGTGIAKAVPSPRKL